MPTHPNQVQNALGAALSPALGFAGIEAAEGSLTSSRALVSFASHDLAESAGPPVPSR
ncbi:MAG: hypothetical protein AB7J35_14475 [Dehalococcoidia bacterium]